MFCNQCQEAAEGTGCTIKGVCGKNGVLSDLQDALLYVCRGIATVVADQGNSSKITAETEKFLVNSLFLTITNANFDDAVFIRTIRQGIELRDKLTAGKEQSEGPACWIPENFDSPAEDLPAVRTFDPDIASLEDLLMFGIKGMAAYLHHAAMMDHHHEASVRFIIKGLAAIGTSQNADALTALVMECGSEGVNVMALLDEANTSTYGHPEISEVNIGVGDRPGILISGHDLTDMEQLLKQTEGTGVDIYTHSEMLPAHYYPAFKKYTHFVGNYGNAWWQQKEEFEAFNGPILMTTNCIVPPKNSYKSRLYTTGAAGYVGCTHIEADAAGVKDFSELIEVAKTCQAPNAIESGKIVGGFAHQQTAALAEKVVDAIKAGAVRKFVVMAGCDGRMSGRNYYTDFAKGLANDTVVLTAGCAKYRYNKLELGDIGGIPRVLDAGQCNDSYSLVKTALLLKEAFGLEDINELPISYNIAWYEQKAVIVLLALLALGVKNIHLGPTLPAFVSPNVHKVLVDKFNIAGISTVEEDLRKIG